MRRTKTLPLTSLYHLQRIFAGCCQPLLGDGPSRRYLCDPCIGAWTLTPGCLSGLSSVSPQRVTASPPLHRVRLIRHTAAMKLQRRPYFEAAVIPLFQAHMLASLPGCTYRADSSAYGQPGPLRHAMDWKLPSRTVTSLHHRNGQLSWRDYHPLDCSLVGCHLQR